MDDQTGPVGRWARGQRGRRRRLDPARAAARRHTGHSGWLGTAQERNTDTIRAAHAEPTDTGVRWAGLLKPRLLRLTVRYPRLGLWQTSDVVLGVQCADSVRGTLPGGTPGGDIHTPVGALIGAHHARSGRGWTEQEWRRVFGQTSG